MPNKIQYSFERFEKKYFITPAQHAILLERIRQYMKEDDFGKYTVCNIYYDTEDWKLIRASIEKPVYKEKLRVRSYGVPMADDKVFVELKKKFDGVVYKRRVTTKSDLVDSLLYNSPNINASQIEKEIKWFQNFYHLSPKVFIGYDRTAFAGIYTPGLRITFDANMRWRTNDLNLQLGDDGNPLISSGKILMEIKFEQAAPLWLSRLLSEMEIFPTTFSKYGTCYREHILQSKVKENNKEVLLSA